MSAILQPPVNLRSLAGASGQIGADVANTVAATTLTTVGNVSSANDVVAANNVSSVGMVVANAGIYNKSKSAFVTPADGDWQMFDQANTSFTTLRLGGSAKEADLYVFANDIMGMRRSTNAQTWVISRSNDGAGNSSQVNIAASGSTVSFSVVEAGTGAGTLLRYTVDKPFKFQGYTVATLPAGGVGDNAYVTDALLPSFLTTIAGGGAVVTPVFYNGSNWVGA